MKNISTNNSLYSLTHPQKRVWYTEKIHPNTPVHNIGGTARFKGLIDFEILQKALNHFVKTNEGLNLRMVEEDGDVRQYVQDFEESEIDFFDFSTYDQPEVEFNRWLEREAERPFDLINGKLFYLAMFKINDHDTGYLGKFHHIISDGWSINIISEEVCKLYVDILEGKELNHEVVNSYLEYIEKEKE